MSEFETVTLYRSTLQDALRHAILRAVWWGTDNPEKDSVKYAEDFAIEKTDWIIKELSLQALTKKIKGEANEIL